jgi:hypothetical protein
MSNGYQSREIDPVSTSGKNSTGADIPKGTIVCRGAGDTITVAGTDTAVFLGVAGEIIENGYYGRVVIRGTVPTLFNAAQTVGVRLTSAASGKAAAATTGDSVIGIAREVGAQDVLAEVELTGPGGVAAPAI